MVVEVKDVVVETTRLVVVPRGDLLGVLDADHMPHRQVVESNRNSPHDTVAI